MISIEDLKKNITEVIGTDDVQIIAYGKTTAYLWWEKNEKGEEGICFSVAGGMPFGYSLDAGVDAVASVACARQFRYV